MGRKKIFKPEIDNDDERMKIYHQENYHKIKDNTTYCEYCNKHIQTLNFWAHKQYTKHKINFIINNKEFNEEQKKEEMRKLNLELLNQKKAKLDAKINNIK